jgi:hypothetical protein
MAGFHLFEKKEDAEEFAKYHKSLAPSVIYRVRYRNVTAKGPQLTHSFLNSDKLTKHYGNCIVAREIFIEPQGLEACA